MGRRRQSVIADLLTLVARAPWPVGVVLAVVSFITLNQIAQGEPVQAVETSNISETVLSTAAVTLATIGQYLLPPLFLVAALGSFLKQFRIRGTFQAVEREPRNGLAKLSWPEFEELVGELFRRRGFAIKQTGKAGPDGGVDVELRRDGKLYLVQCKHWHSRPVAVDQARALFGVMAARQAAGGFLVTSGKFTEDAKSFAAGINLELVDGDSLIKYLERPREPEVWNMPMATPKLDRTTVHPPLCPTCGKAMVERIARKGPQPGSRFWGCSDFPACRGTRKIGD